MNRRIMDSGPLPVARAYRQMYEQADPAEAFHSIALFSEPLIKWFGVLSLASLRERIPDRLRGSGLLPQFLSPSLGDWVQIIRLAVKSTTDLSCYAPLPDALNELAARQNDAVRAATLRMGDYLDTDLAKKTLLDFLSACVAYRNKTRGHGAPSSRHRADFAGIIREAWDEFLTQLDLLYRLPLIYIERSENIEANALHTIRTCNGLHSTVMAEKLTLPKSRALSSRSVHLFSEHHRPLVELSPILVRHSSNDSFCFLNSGRKALEYLCYDGDHEEYYRPDGYDTAIRTFFGDIGIDDSRFVHRETTEGEDDEEMIDLPFGSLGVRQRRSSPGELSPFDPRRLLRWFSSRSDGE